MASFLVGLLVIALGFALLGNEVKALLWRLKAKWYYVEGVARVEKTEIVVREGVFDLQITYHLEQGRHHYPTETRLEQDDPSTSTRAFIEKRQAKFEPGQLYRCRYWPDDPTFNELAPEGLQLDLPLKRLWIPPAVWLLAWWLCRWPWVRWIARGAA